jgi:DNA primase
MAKKTSQHAAPEVAIRRVVEAAGVALERKGAALVGVCPFHADPGASLVMDPAANTWRCATCNTTGGPVEWVMKAEGVSRRHALELLAEGLPFHGKSTAGAVKLATVRKLAPPVTPDADDQELLRQVVAFYHQTLKASPEALAYLESRGIRSAEAIERFKLGYANRTLGLRLPAKNRRLGAELRGRLTKLGLYRDTGREHMNGCLVVPVFGAGGQVVQVYGRKITPGLRPGTALHVFLPGAPRGVWNLEALAASSTLILASSLLDALTFWSAGFRNVTAIYGPKGVPEDLFAVLRQHGTRTALLAMRRDAEGDRCVDALAAKLAAQGVSSYRVQFPAGHDANDLARAADDPGRVLGRVLRQAVWLGKGKAPEVEVEPMIDRPRGTARQTYHEPAAAPLEPATDHDDQEGLHAPTAALEPQELASPELPPPAAPEVPTETSEQEVAIRLGDRRYRVRGLARNMSYDTLRVNLLVTLEPASDAFHADTLDLYSARQRGAFVKQAATELGLREVAIKHDLGRVLLKLEELQEEQIRAALEPKRKAVAVADGDQVAALDLLRDPHLVDRILADFERVGVVGEATNKLVAYLAAISRKLDDPLAILIQSSSAAGKTSLMDAVLAFVPEEDRLHFAAMTGQSLFYMGEGDLQHRVLAIAEEEGAARASYALKLLQSEGELTIASTGKDSNTGRLVAQEYVVRGPVMLFLTTTAIDLDEELLNRCLVLTVDEDREQTRAIHRLQRERQTLAGLLAQRDREAILKLHRDAQRLLRPLLVVNPFAPSLTFLDDRTRTRRDHTKYLALIRTIALLHQHQREVKPIEHGGQRVEYVEATLEDVALANRLAHHVLGRSLDDVPPHTRRLLALLHDMVTAGCAAQGVERAAYRFTRRVVREATGWGDTQLKVHLRRLVELEHLLVHGGRGQHVYELVYDGQGQGGERFLTGLLDPEKLRRSALEPQRSGSGRPSVGQESGDGRDGVPPGTASHAEEIEPASDSPENATSQGATSGPSYAQGEEVG